MPASDMITHQDHLIPGVPQPSQAELDQACAELGQLSLADGLRWVAGRFPGASAFSTSLGQEDQVISDAIFANRLGVRVFTLETGRLFPETLALLDQTRQRYSADIEAYYPDPAAVAALVRAKGEFSFYESIENRKECCHIRKVEPLQRALRGAHVWVTGLRAEQSPNRATMRILEWDPGYRLYKFNPLIQWSYPQVLDYIQANQVPDNPLHRTGFISIGCAPCTRAIEPGEDPRAGRWWWETSKKECGLHRS
jgi:phosphoadenosine phosphosulfate reductase